jgi:hypothetical protein
MFAALGIVSGVQRFFAMLALSIALGGCLAAWVKARDIRIAHAAAAQRDAIWSEKLRIASEIANRERDTLQAKVDQIAVSERAKAAGDVLAAMERTAQIEQALAALKADPVVWPRAIARTLRK